MPFFTKQYKFCAAHRYWNDKWSKEDNFKHFGDEKFAKPISKKIVKVRERKNINTENLVEIIESIKKKKV